MILNSNYILIIISNTNFFKRARKVHTEKRRVYLILFSSQKKRGKIFRQDHKHLARFSLTLGGLKVQENIFETSFSYSSVINNARLNRERKKRERGRGGGRGESEERAR